MGMERPLPRSPLQSALLLLESLPLRPWMKEQCRNIFVIKGPRVQHIFKLWDRDILATNTWWMSKLTEIWFITTIKAFSMMAKWWKREEHKNKMVLQHCLCLTSSITWAVRTAKREVRLRVALRTDPGVATSCFSPLAVLQISLWLITGVDGSEEE